LLAKPTSLINNAGQFISLSLSLSLYLSLPLSGYRIVIFIAEMRSARQLSFIYPRPSNMGEEGGGGGGRERGRERGNAEVAGSWFSIFSASANLMAKVAGRGRRRFSVPL